MKCLLIDVNSIIPYYTAGYVSGIGRSTLELLNALSKIGDLPFEIVLFSQNTRGVKAKKYFPFKYLHFYLPNRPVFKNLIRVVRMKRWFCKYDLIHMPNNTDIVENEKSVIYTIHDLIVWHYPEMWGVENDTRFFSRLKSSFRNCKAIVTCSDASKKDIIDFAQIPEEKVVSIPWGIDRIKFCPTKDTKYIKKIGINSLYYFSASCNHPRKNLPLLLEAFQLYLRYGGKGQLVLLNPIDTDLVNYQDLLDARKIIICRGISDEELVELYTHAQASIVVSGYEGFGLPVLESLSCYTMVLSAHNSSLIEAGGDIVDYFERLDAESISKKLLRYDFCSKIETLKKEDVDIYLSQFTWEKCARQYVEFYKKQLDIS